MIIPVIVLTLLTLLVATESERDAGHPPSDRTR